MVGMGYLLFGNWRRDINGGEISMEERFRWRGEIRIS